jgi:anti-sigma B factor antagonist
MEIIKTAEDKKLAVEVKGRLDTTTAPELEAALKESMEGIEELTLNFAELEYISSAGLRVLLATQKAMQGKGKMIVTGVNDIVMEVFEVTGFCDILNIAK